MDPTSPDVPDDEVHADEHMVLSTEHSRGRVTGGHRPDCVTIFQVYSRHLIFKNTLKPLHDGVADYLQLDNDVIMIDTEGGIAKVINLILKHLLSTITSLNNPWINTI